MNLPDLSELLGLLYGLLGALLLAGAWLDLRWRALPLILPLLILAIAAAVWATSLRPVTAPGVLQGAAITAGLGLGATTARVMGISDGLVGGALLLVLLSLDSDRQIEAAVWGALGTTAGVLAWTIYRVVRSLIVSGAPRNLWDLLALMKGRPEREPWLPGYKIKRRETWLMDHIEAFRTPDDLKLGRDPCPLVSCLFLGYLGMVGSLI